MKFKNIVLLLMLFASLVWAGDRYAIPYLSGVMEIEYTPVFPDIKFLQRDSSQIEKISTVKIRNVVIEVEIARTFQEKRTGLSGKESLAENAGMLFVYDVAQHYGIWMQDMNFAIDIIWIGSNKTVVDITPNLSPETYPDVFQPSRPAQYILEVNAGFAQRHNIQIGDIVDMEI